MTQHQLLGHPTSLQGHLEAHGLIRAKDPAWQRAVISWLESSGLTGRGGGGFPASVKLALARSRRRGGIVVVNAMEGEPASDKDKVLLTRAPHLVLDGAEVLAALVRADQVIVCVSQGRDDVAAAVDHAIAERSTNRYTIGGNIPQVVRPPDGFVAGEESALANWLSSGISLPTFRPDKGIPVRVGRRQALIHNAETVAHVGLIARHGPMPFRARGTDTEPGTTLMTLSGAVLTPGVVEIDRGTPIADIVRLASPSEPIQAILVGGYGGAWVGPQHFHLPYANGPLRQIHGTTGVGVIVVLGQNSCGITETARIARYLAQQSAGQCGPCIFGLPAIADDLTHLAQGRADRILLDRLEQRLGDVEGRGACRHPDGVVNLVRSALRVFVPDVAAHARNNPCRERLSQSCLAVPELNAA